MMKKSTESTNVTKKDNASSSSEAAKPKKKLTDLALDNLKHTFDKFLTVEEQQNLRLVNRFFN